MLKIAKIPEINLQDDVIFNRIALVLYAQGCKWKCKGCHSKELWTFEGGIDITIEDIKDQLNFLQLDPKDITLVGQGGDFWFQLDKWLNFCKEIKKNFPQMKIFWQTGADKKIIGDLITIENAGEVFDAIACERPFAEKLTGENRKYVFILEDGKIKEEGWKILS